MSDVQMKEFYKRVRRIDRRHRSLARGFVLSLSRDGLIVAKPASDAWQIPWRGLLLVLVAMMGFKALLHAQIGAEAYNGRVAALSVGTLPEQIGAYVMHADPITLWLSQRFEGVTF